MNIIAVHELSTWKENIYLLELLLLNSSDREP